MRGGKGRGRRGREGKGRGGERDSPPPQKKNPGAATGWLLHLVQREGDWAGPQSAQAPPRYTKYDSPSMASVPVTVLLYNGPLCCGVNVPIVGLRSITSVLIERAYAMSYYYTSNFGQILHSFRHNCIVMCRNCSFLHPLHCHSTSGVPRNYV